MTLAMYVKLKMVRMVTKKQISLRAPFLITMIFLVYVRRLLARQLIVIINPKKRNPNIAAKK
jgi:hypothetical protein